MTPTNFPRRLAAGLACVAALLAAATAQTLTLQDEVRRSATLTNTAVTLAGRSQLFLTGTGDPLTGSTVDLTSEDSWVFFPAIPPSALNAPLGRLRVNGAAAVAEANVRVASYGNGSVVIPHPAGYQPLQVFSGTHFSGGARKLSPYTAYGNAALGPFADKIRSFILKRGYTATFAQNENGTGVSRNYVAQDADLEVALMPAGLDGTASFVRVFPWRWTAKKGSCDVDPAALKANWNYNWNINSNSSPDIEYVAIRQQRWWPGLDQNWKTRGVNHLSGYNEPNNPVEDAYTSLDNGSTATAVAAWPDLLATGLRVGAPAVTDGGAAWIADFMAKANAAGARVDYVPVHYYRSVSNNANPAGAATQLYNFLKGIHDTVQRPIWVTEFNNGANWTGDADPTVDQNRAVIEAMINMMDSTPWIERYAIYSRVEWTRQTHYDDGSITPMGAMYRDHVSPIAYQQVVPDAGRSPAAEYGFEGNARDSSGNGNHPLLYGTPKWGAGRQGQSASFDGTDDFLALPAGLGDSADFTFCAWVKWNGGTAWQRIFDLGNGTANYLFLSPGNGSSLRFAIRQNNGTEQTLSAPQLQTGVWTHVAVTLNGNTGKLYVNGAAVDTQTITLNPSDLGTVSNYLGKSQFAADPLFNGELDSVRFLTTALSDSQIAALATAATGPAFAADPIVWPATAPRQVFTAALAPSVTGGGPFTFTKLGGPAWLAVAADGKLTGVPTLADSGPNALQVRVTDSAGLSATARVEIPVAQAPGLVARLAFDGNASAAAGGADGVASGNPAYATGQRGSAIVFDGADDSVTLPAGIANSDEITLAMWVNWTGGATWQRIFDFGNGPDASLFLTPRSGSNTLRFAIFKDAGAEQRLEAPQLVANTWTHVAITLGGGTGRLYVNGTLADTEPISLKPSDLMPANLLLGDSQFAADPLFSGRLDEFLVFNRALDASEVAALPSAAPPVFAGAPISKPAATVGTAYIDLVTATGTGLVFSKVSGPRWLLVDPDGRISGVPASADAGPNRFTVRATAANGLAADAIVNLTVTPPADLLALYPFPGNVADAAGSRHGAATGSPAYVSGFFDPAIDLDGADDFVTLPAGIGNGLAAATFSVRFRWDGGNDWQRVFDFGNGTGSYLFLSPSSGGKTLRFAITTGSGEQVLNGPLPPVGEWTHVAVTLDGGIGTLYVNGAVVDSKAITLRPADIATTANYVGKSQFAADPLFNGAIDDFRIASRGLTTTEVAALAVPPAATVVPRSAYAVWARGISFPAGEDGAADDPDRDGVANGFEYLLAADPLVAAPRTLPEARVFRAADLGLAGEKHYLGVSARLRADRSGITVVADAAATPSDLATPAAASRAIHLDPPVADGAFEVHTWYHEVAIEDGGTGFIRLRARFE